jgi:hypothetical protein
LGLVLEKLLGLVGSMSDQNPMRFLSKKKSSNDSFQPTGRLIAWDGINDGLEAIHNGLERINDCLEASNGGLECINDGLGNINMAWKPSIILSHRFRLSVICIYLYSCMSPVAMMQHPEPRYGPYEYAKQRFFVYYNILKKPWVTP